MNGTTEKLQSLLEGLSAKKRAFVVFALGAMAALSMAPLHWSPILFISFSGFFLIVNTALSSCDLRQRAKRAAGLGWCFGFGFFLAGLWWIGAAVLVEADQFAWALPFAVAGLPAGLALFWALAGCISALFWYNNLQKILALTISFGLAEYARGHVLTGFPWNAIGYGAMPSPVLMQSASVIGLWGVTLLTILVVTMPGLLLISKAPRNTGIRPTFVLVIVIGLLSLHIGFGLWRLNGAEIIIQQTSETILRLVQPNISQEEKWRQGNEDAVFQSYLDLTSAPGLDKIGAVIWPESAFPFLILQTPAALARIDQVLPDQTLLLTGAVRAKPPERSFSDTPPKLKFFNSLLIFDDKAQRQQVYDKQRLVPFGEFMPFGDILEQWGITNLVNIPGGFADGSNGNLINFTQINSAHPTLPPASVLICYEAIFPGSFELSSSTHNNAAATDSRAEWLLNVTNDAWFGELAGPYQHFHQARLRAVEQGLPMARVANTGISAMIDPYGRIVQKIGLGETGIIDVALPKPLNSTGYSKSRDLTFAIFMALFCSLLFACTLIKRAD